MLLAVHRLSSKAQTYTLACAIAASLCIAHFGSSFWVDGNFYLLPTRVWELMCGALLAKLELEKKHLPATLDTPLCSISALALILLSFWFFDETTAHPSLLTAIPVFATVWLIGAKNPAKLVISAFTNKVVVFIGLISYSLYLWHFPIFAFARTHLGNLTSVESALLISLSLFAACIAYFGLEKALRNSKKWPTKPLMLGLGASFLVLVTVFTSISASDGAPWRLGPVHEFLAPTRPDHIENGDYDTKGFTSRIINVGDSHADVFSGSLSSVAKNRKLNFTQMIQAGCPLAPGVRRYDDGKFKGRCTNIQTRWLENLVAYDNAMVFYSARFSLYLNGERFDNKEGGSEPGYQLLLTTEKSAIPNALGVSEAVQKALTALLDTDKKLILIYPIPEVGWDVPRLVKRQLGLRPSAFKMSKLGGIKLSTSHQRFIERNKQVFEMYDSIPDHDNLLRFYPSDYLCSNLTGRCSIHNQKQLYYYDDNHLTKYMASKLISELEKKLNDRGWL